MSTETETVHDDPQGRFIYTITSEHRKALLSTDPQEFESAFNSIAKGIRDTYEQEGLVLIRGLLEEDSLLQRLSEDAQAVMESVKIETVFSSSTFGNAFSFPKADGTETSNGGSFREAALTSTIPAFIAKVLLCMDQDDTTNSLRLLKDAFLAKGKEQSHCGWHVDDSGFWPTNSQSNGVNVWIALDDMPAKYGGGMTVSPKSHKAEWRQDAYKTIGSTKIIPIEGVHFDSPMFLQVFGKTCSMDTLDPALSERIESSKVEFDYLKGDCLFCTRWLFHRSVEINEEGLKHYGEDVGLKRYTIRYERGSAQTYRGWSMEPCILMDPNNSGKSLDKICESAGPFYPQCWPRLSDQSKQEAQMETLVRDKFPEIKIKRGEALKAITEHFNKAKSSESTK
eukprot:CAMPEP_0198260786 /NCGR_PEP_ID=MMETSP1447-20131203/9666_1 /TAXON_ID=420782 /ORGANISM="Chaetoceros dichaeta, Strain CCMP1751" /LENGTH=395 /DNA_ID=CAMNT_0043948515 /DNA_START=180 /DNA_END=1367 /DNA_ORIENTATION=+